MRQSVTIFSILVHATPSLAGSPGIEHKRYNILHASGRATAQEGNAPGCTTDHT